MYITYHLECAIPKGFINLTHDELAKPIQEFIEKNDVKQSSYHVNSNAYYTFIGLNNGDRIDVKHS